MNCGESVARYQLPLRPPLFLRDLCIELLKIGCALLRVPPRLREAVKKPFRLSQKLPIRQILQPHSDIGSVDEVNLSPLLLLESVDSTSLVTCFRRNLPLLGVSFGLFSADGNTRQPG